MEAREVVRHLRGEKGGDGEVVLGIWEWGKNVCWESFCCAGYVLAPSSIWHCYKMLIFWCLVEMKLITAAIYTSFTTHISDDEGIEQIDAYTAGPKSNRLLLRFERVE